MRNVYLCGSGMTAVAEHYSRSIVSLAAEALRLALGPVAPERVGTLVVANAYGGTLAGQASLGAAVAGACGLHGAEAFTVEAGGASGGIALRQGLLAIASGACDLVVVLGVEKASDRLDGAAEAAQALSLDSDFEAAQGLTMAGQWALLMRRYMHEYGVDAAAFAPFPINAHRNGVQNPLALYRFPISGDKFRTAPLVAAPLSMLDCPTLVDGAAAVVLAAEGIAQDLVAQPIRIAGSAVATDTLLLAQRPNLLHLDAAARSGADALARAGIGREAVNLLELTDPHGIAAVLSLEALGFAAPGCGTALGADGAIVPGGRTPLANAGGIKARGDLGGATGVYQVAELAAMLRRESGVPKEAGSRVALAQCLGGVGSTAATHILVVD